MEVNLDVNLETDTSPQPLPDSTNSLPLNLLSHFHMKSEVQTIFLGVHNSELTLFPLCITPRKYGTPMLSLVPQALPLPSPPPPPLKSRLLLEEARWGRAGTMELPKSRAWLGNPLQDRYSFSLLPTRNVLSSNMPGQSRAPSLCVSSQR